MTAIVGDDPTIKLLEETPNINLCGKTKEWEYFGSKRVITCAPPLHGKYLILQSQIQPFEMEEIFFHGGSEEELIGKNNINNMLSCDVYVTGFILRLEGCFVL